MTKGFLGYGESEAKTVYGAYTALVYMTPFFGGMLADRLLGQRIAVIIGGILMAAGHLLMGVENTYAFYFALALLIAGNGMFKPNISTIVGDLYKPGDSRRDGGFTIFYMGVNLGAAMSPLLCGYVGETFGWHYGFGLATIGMLIGLAVFVMPTLITQLLIGAGAAITSIALLYYHPENAWATSLNVMVAVALAAAAAISIQALAKGGLPGWAGAPPDKERVSRGLPAVLIGIAVVIPVMALFVSGFSLLNEGKQYQLIPEQWIKDFVKGEPADAAASAAAGAEATGNKSIGDRMRAIAGIFLGEVSRPAGLLLTSIGILSFGYLILKTFTLDTIARHRMIVALTLIFFSMLFWSFFEQAGSSLNFFADRNIDRVTEESRITADQVGSVIRIQPTQEQLGYTNGSTLFTLDQLDKLRSDEAAKENANVNFEFDWTVAADNVGMGLAPRKREFPASAFQSVNAVCILVLGMVFTALWSWLAARKLEPSTPVKFALGLIQLGLGFGAFWMGAQAADSRGMVAAIWLVAGYALHTTGELCLSPVGLSMITKLSPKVLVSTMMGAWFLATAFSQYLAGIISQFTGVEEGGGEGSGIPVPLATVNTYGDVFGKIAIAAIICGTFCLVLSPILKAWMHTDVPDDDPSPARGGH
jgi:POT family proton-dependent oligopeptide transporter